MSSQVQRAVQSRRQNAGMLSSTHSWQIARINTNSCASCWGRQTVASNLASTAGQKLTGMAPVLAPTKFGTNTCLQNGA